MGDNMAKRLERELALERNAALAASTPQGQMIGSVMRAIAPIIQQYVAVAISKATAPLERHIANLERRVAAAERRLK